VDGYSAYRNTLVPSLMSCKGRGLLYLDHWRTILCDLNDASSQRLGRTYNKNAAGGQDGVNVMTLREAQTFFPLCGDGGANAAAGVDSKGREQNFSHSYINNKELNGAQDFVNIFRKRQSSLCT
jgi:hypothetical protein